MLSCTEISFVIFFLLLRNLESNPCPFTQLNQAYLLKTWKKVNLICFTKMIADQSSVIQYA